MKTFPELDNIEVKKLHWWYRPVKRTFDLLTSLFVILVFSWFYLLMAIIIAISTHGNPFYGDVRVGRWGKEIKVLKFRSMFIDANDRPEKYLNKKQLEQFYRERKVDNDPRVTKIGHFIRKTSIDELPQFFNIFIGNMSFVGPRPITKEELQNFTEKQQEIFLSAKPGLTGHWQVSGRSEVSFRSGKRQKLELEYFTIRSTWTDLKILFKTVPAVLKHRGAK